MLLLVVGGCNDLTTPLPPLTGTWQYAVTSAEFVRHNRVGSIRIVDDDPRSARFDGTYSFRNAQGETLSGSLIGAFITRDSIWFRFVDNRLEYHEAKLTGGIGSGEIFFLTLTYEASGSRFTLRR